MDESASNSVASLASHVQIVAEAAGDSSLTLEKVAKQNENLLAALRMLRETGDNGTTHLSDIDKKSLEAIINTLAQTMFGNLDKLHGEDQVEVNSAHAAVVQCNTDLQATRDGKVAEASRRTQAAREIHSSGRADESALATANASKWSDYKNLVNTITAPTSCPTFTPTLSAMDTFFSSEDNGYIKWYLEKQAEFKAKKAAYESANGALSAKHSEADRFQGNFENQYCSYKGQEINMCSAYGTCRAGALDTYDATTKRVRLSEASRKAYLKSGHAVICHVKAILGGDNKTHSQCEQELAGVDTAKLAMHFPSVPAAEQCDFTAAAASQPCDSTFRTAEYGGLASNVHPTTCSRCAWEPPTPSPTPSPTPGPTTFCEVGQTQGGGPWVFQSSDNSRSACEATCKRAPGCVAFDFTTMISEKNPCRGAPAGQQPRSGDGGRHHRKYCTIPSPTQPGPTTFCEVGQTQGGGPWVFESSDNSKSACEAACKLAPGCVAFDFTTMISGQSTCRGAPAGQQPRSGDGGHHHRQYCTILSPTQT